jgi:hypothetical protein
MNFFENDGGGWPQHRRQRGCAQETLAAIIEVGPPGYDSERCGSDRLSRSEDGAVIVIKRGQVRNVHDNR